MEPSVINEENYDEPIWKSKIKNSFYKPVSYTRTNQGQFLNKEAASRNQELFLKLFDQDPNSIVCDEKEYKKTLFEGIEKIDNDQHIDDVPKNRSLAIIEEFFEKNKDKHHYSKDAYVKMIKKKKEKLQKAFEKTDVFQTLKSLKYTPLKIQTVDSFGNVVKNYEYYYDYEKDKHEYIRVQDEEQDSDQSPTLKRKSIKENDVEEKADQKTNKKRRTDSKPTKPIVQSKPIVPTKPTVKSKPIVKGTPIVKTKPIVKSTPIIPAKPIIESTPIVETTPIAEITTPRSKKRKIDFDKLCDESLDSFNRSDIKSTSTPTRRMKKVEKDSIKPKAERRSKRSLAKIVEKDETMEEIVANDDDKEEDFWIQVPVDSSKDTEKDPEEPVFKRPRRPTRRTKK